MDINIQHYLNRTADEQVQHFEQSITPEAAASDAALQTAIEQLATAINGATAAGELMRATLTVSTPEPTLISLETGVINLPLANAKKVGGFFEPDEIVPVKIYLVVESKFLNASGLHISLLATSGDFAKDSSSAVSAAVTQVSAYLLHIQEEAAKPEPEPTPAKKPAAKKTTRRTTKKTTSKRKPAAKKTTTRKTAAKKSTTKTAAKKTTTRKTTTKAAAKKAGA
ncbi:hypothetical protein [Lacticaseibacillus zhaodongensis]|uniref:hypothetical protein n=1 Tax=Lacticaseibacillus zhaodongensis TaxID=2668065 RepID=UPI0012D3431C|nr:hypothetical protein [Lacticaseibacillus zhaodongensis]